jgi:dienelactone hydrolase
MRIVGNLVRVPLGGISVLAPRASPYLGLGSRVASVPAYRAVPPAGPANRQGSLAHPLLLVHGAWGLEEALCDLAEQLAAEGRVVLAPDLAGGSRPADAEAAAALLAGLDPDAAIRALAASIDALRADPAGRDDRPAAGGRPARGDRVDAVGFGGGAPLAAFLAVVRPEIGRLVLVGGDPPDLPLSAWDPLEADALVLLGSDQDEGPAAGWTATLEGLGRHVAIETLPAEVVADDPAEPLVGDRIRDFLARTAG